MLREQALLLELGRRLRSARESAELSVSQLARDAGLSRRHVTETEAGRANPSILKLAQLAAALRIPLGDLCDLGGVARGERLALVGLRGAGKTSVGRALARQLEARSEEHTSELQSRRNLVCRLLLEKKKILPIL